MIVGEGSKLGAGQMLNEDSVKGRSTVTKSASEKNLAGNPFQALSLLPSINTYSPRRHRPVWGWFDSTGFWLGSTGFYLSTACR